MNHRVANFVKQEPGAAIAAKAKIFLEIESTHSSFLSGKPPDCVEPDFQTQATRLKNRSSSDIVLETARLTPAKSRSQGPVLIALTRLTLKAF